MKKLNNIQKNLLLLVLFCITLSLIRIKVTGNILFTFLLWNLFLAIVPYGISTKLRNSTLDKISKLTLSIYIFIWLVFFPNAPYIITDFIHLPISKPPVVWLDVLLIFTYSVAGLLFSLISLNDIFIITKEKWNLKKANYLVLISSFLCGFGIYLGRFLRFNSWDLFTSPLQIIKESFVSFSDLKTWLITFGFGTLIWILFSIFRALRNPSESV